MTDREPRDDKPRISFPPKESWNFFREFRGLGDDIEEEVRDIIRRYHQGDESVTAERYGPDKMTIRAMVKGACLEVDVRQSEEYGYVVLGANER